MKITRSADDLAKFGYLQWHLTQHPEDRMVLAGHPEVIGGLDYVVADGLADQEQFRRFLG